MESPFTTEQVIDQYRKFVIGNYKRYPVCLVRGEGSRVWDAEGREYLDFFPGWGCGGSFSIFSLIGLY